MSAIHLDPTKRHDFVYLFDVADGNPNGDPDAGNQPRIDSETNQGLVSDVSIKRRIRNYVEAVKGSTPGYEIYIQNKGIALQDLNMRAFTALGIKPKGVKEVLETQRKTAEWMCRNFFDIRVFGAVLSTKAANCGQVTGPVQLTIARSVDPIDCVEMGITRVAITKPENLASADDTDDDSKKKTTEMGSKWIVPYGLYIGYGWVTPTYKTGMTEEDLRLVWEGLEKGFELNRTASRGRMACRGIYIFTHENPLGNAPAHKLQERISVRLREPGTTPRAFSDYEVIVDDADLPAGVTLTRLAE